MGDKMANKAFADFFGNDANFDFENSGSSMDEETGELDIDLDTGDTESSNNLNNADGVDEDDAAEETEDDAVSGDPDLSPAAQAKFRELETSLDAVVTTLQTLGNIIKQKGGVVAQQPAQVEEEDLDYSDPKAFKSQVQGWVQEAIQSSLAPMQQVTKETQVRNQINDALTKHGQAFRDSIPHISLLLKDNPNMNLESAFQIVQQIRGTKATAKSDGVIPAESQQVPTKNPVPKKRIVPAERPAAALAQRAANLQVERGVSSTDGKKRAANLDDAIDDAFKQLKGRGAV